LIYANLAQGIRSSKSRNRRAAPHLCVCWRTPVSLLSLNLFCDQLLDEKVFWTDMDTYTINFDILFFKLFQSLDIWGFHRN